MQFLKLALLVGGLVLLSTSAYSQEAWRTGPSTSAQNAAGTGFPLCTKGITPGTTCYWTFNNISTDSPVINITAEYAMLSFDADIAATGTGNTIRVHKVIGAACTGPSTVASDNDSEPIVFPALIAADAWVTELTGASGIDIARSPLHTGCYFISPGSVTTEDGIVMLTGAPVGRQ